MLGGNRPCKLNVFRSSSENADPLLNWDEVVRLLPLYGHSSGPDAARGRCLNFDACLEKGMVMLFRAGSSIWALHKAAVAIDD
jgi:hypothetical protein